EELPQVHVHDPVVPFLHVLTCLPDRVMAPPPRPEAVAGFGECRVKDWCQYLQECLLDQAVHHGGNTQHPLAAARFRDFDPADWLRSVGPPEQFLTDALPLRADLVPQPFGGDTVHAWGA